MCMLVDIKLLGLMLKIFWVDFIMLNDIFDSIVLKHSAAFCSFTYKLGSTFIQGMCVAKIHVNYSRVLG